MYLKTWMGVISGSMAGRNDGYPEQKRRVYDNIEDLARDFGTKNDEKYYKLTEVDAKTLESEVIEALNKQKDIAKENKAKHIEDEITKLQKELKTLK